MAHHHVAWHGPPWEVECRSRKLILWKREVEGFVEGREARLNFKKNGMFNWAYNTVLWCFMASLPFELMGNFDFNWTVGENWVPKKPGESCRNDETTKRPGRFNGFFRQRTARLKRSHWRRCFGVFCWNELGGCWVESLNSGGCAHSSLQPKCTGLLHEDNLFLQTIQTGIVFHAREKRTLRMEVIQNVLAWRGLFYDFCYGRQLLNAGIIEQPSFLCKHSFWWFYVFWTF